MHVTSQGVLRLAVLVLCVAGAWVCSELVKEQAGPWPSSEHASGAAVGLCGSGPDGQSACATVLDSKWSAVDFTVPVVTRNLTVGWSRVVIPTAFVGLGYFVFLGVWYALAGAPHLWGYRWFLVPLSAVLAGSAGSALLLWILLFKVEAPCTWCLVTHGINGLVLLGTLCLWPRKQAPAALRATAPSRVRFVRCDRPKLTTWSALRVTGFAVLLILGLWVYRGAKLDIRRQVARLLPYKELVDAQQKDPTFLLREYYAVPQRLILARAHEAQADTCLLEPRLDIFVDFQCPHCACFASRWRKDFQPLWQGPLRIRLRHFPLWPDCNNAVTERIHAQACQASYAAEAARLQGGDEAFWQMHHALFRNSRRLGEDLYAELAAELGLDSERLLADMRDPSVRQAVAADIDLAAELGVTGTPAVFLNGRPVPPLSLYNPVFWEAVSADLQAQAVVAAGDQSYFIADESPIAER
ncbi:MAG: DsbA family protein [Phycisphaerales bacterium]|nr:MAG: DsbA family protein [Phycisphaerales bacterium]